MMKEFVYISQTKNIMLISFDVNVHSLRTSAGIPALVPNQGLDDGELGCRHWPFHHADHGVVLPGAGPG